MSSQNEDWLNKYSGIPYISDEMLIEMNLFDDLDKQISGMTAYFYQNPFWSDSTDPLRDTACRAAARHMTYHSAMYNKEVIANVSVRPPSFAKSFGKLVWSQTTIGSIQNAVRNIKYEKSSAKFHSQQSWIGPNLVQAVSLKRYEKWLGKLYEEDASLYISIQNWHQQEELIHLQQTQVNLDQRQIELMKKANQIAKQQLESTRNQTETLRKSREDSLKVQNSLNQIKRELE
jgi:hypothetical protein